MTHALAFALGLLVGASLRAWWAYGAGWDAALEHELPPEPDDDIDWLGERSETGGTFPPGPRSVRVTGVFGAPGHGTGDLLHTWRETTADRRN